VGTVQQCIASSEAGCRQHRHVSTQLKRQQALRCSGFGLNKQQQLSTGGDGKSFSNQ